MIDSSPPSAESSFRELDDVFLQTQTRIWLGEVLSLRLDEDLLLSDLLQDGEILFEVSKLVWDLLLTKCMELRHLKHKYGPFGSKRSSGRYRPYSNVDSFIKICKILGLSGIDLFSPSDVVEKRDIRKICICIRALSKKARSKQLSVPDFDMVIYSVAMPKNMVGLIRQGLESSHCTLSSSSSYSSPKVSQKKLKKKNLHAPSKRDDDYSCSSDESDEAESRYMGENSLSSVGEFDFNDGVNSKLENSPDGERSKHAHHKSASLPETVQTISQRHLEDSHELDKMSSCGDIGIANSEFALENDYSVVGDSDSNYISDYLAFSDLMVHATDSSNSVIRDGENNMFDFFLNVDSKGPTSNRKNSRRKFSDDEDTEVSSTTSMSSVLGRLLNLEFDDQYDEDGSLSTKEREPGKHCKDSLVLSKTYYPTALFDSREAQYEMAEKGDLCDVKTGNPETENEDIILFHGNEDSGNFNDHVSTDIGSSHISDMMSDCLESSCKSISDVGGFSVPDTPPVVPDQITVAQVNYLCETNSNNQLCLPTKDENGPQEYTSLPDNTQENISSAAEKSHQDNSISTGRKDSSLRLPPGLRTVVKGTAVAGVLFLLLHISGIIKGSSNHNAQGNKQYGQVLKNSHSKSSSTKRRTASVGKGIYPTEKIKL